MTTLGDVLPERIFYEEEVFCMGLLWYAGTAFLGGGSELDRLTNQMIVRERFGTGYHIWCT